MRVTATVSPSWGRAKLFFSQGAINSERYYEDPYKDMVDEFTKVLRRALMNPVVFDTRMIRPAKATLQRRQGPSRLPLVRRGDYAKNIESVIKGKDAEIRPKDVNVVGHDGQSTNWKLANVAYWLEFGASSKTSKWRIPPRPLWRAVIMHFYVKGFESLRNPNLTKLRADWDKVG